MSISHARVAVRLALAFDHYAASGLVMARAGTTLCRILQAELEPVALLA